MEPLVDARDVHFPTEVPFVESVSTNSIFDLLMVAFISRYCTMAIIEVDMLSQYSDVHGSREFIELSLCVIPSTLFCCAINITIDNLYKFYDQSECMNVDQSKLQVHHLTTTVMYATLII